MAKRIEDAAFAFQECIQQAAKARDDSLLVQADTQLALLKRRLRMAKEMELMNLGQYEHVAQMTAELGRLLGAWMKRPAGRATRPRTKG